MIVTAKTFMGTMRMLKSFMERREGALDWVKDHNSKFEMNKIAVMHCQLSARKPANCPNPVLQIEGKVIQEVMSYKYLGVHIDSQLRWRTQEMK